MNLKNIQFYNKIGIIFTALLVLVLLGGAFFYVSADVLNSTVTITIQARVCGNGSWESGEDCDNTDLNGNNCHSLGYAGGDLSCNPDCTFDTSECIEKTSTGPSGGGPYPFPPGQAEVILKGEAFPGGEIVLLAEGKEIQRTSADSLGNFYFKISKFTSGTWTFSLWATDKEGRKSSTFSVTSKILSRVVTTISGILLSPTVELSKIELKKGEALNIFGQSAPESEITIIVLQDEPIKQKITKTTKAGKDGFWFYEFDTTGLNKGKYTIKVKSVSLDGLISLESFTFDFYMEISKLAKTVYSNADLNGDDKVDLVDFSIILYWWGEDSDSVDLNNDGIVNLPDFSIMMYYWTG